MEKRSAQGQETRSRLLEATSKLFRSQGFHATGLDEVLRKSGAPKGSLYHYFPGGKDQLAIEALQYVACQLEEMMSALLHSDGDPVNALQGLLALMTQQLAESDFRDGCPIAAVTLDVASDRESIREACQQGFQVWLRLFIEHLVNAGLSEARAKTVATLFLAAFEGGLILSRAQKSVEPLEAVASELARVIEGSLAHRSRQASRQNS
jgi:TetR/AcrR family transcriptional regulator, lmrAB and yxaGH operons repressor